MYHQRFKTEQERFAEKHEISENGCLIWKTAQSVPYFRPTGASTPIRASRYAWEKANGRPLEPGECVCHTCDNPKCVNPDHLFIGTHLDNMRDKAAKGRTHKPKGERNGRAKITAEIARTIRERYAAGGVSQQDLGDEYGLSQWTVGAIILGRTWKNNP